MKTKFKKSNSRFSATLLLLSLILILSTALLNLATVIAAEQITFEGTFQGANCVHYKMNCPEDDVHIALEHDFVLLLPDGSHWETIKDNPRSQLTSLALRYRF